jgi:hypothetical protein
MLLAAGTLAASSFRLLLLGGTVMHHDGRLRILLLPLPVLAIICAAPFFVRRNARLHRHAVGAAG